MYRKLLAWTIVVIVPLSFYIFFKYFFHNPTSDPLPIYGHKDISPTTQDTIYHQLPDFQLIAHHKDTINKLYFANKLHIANFFFTRCPGMCPILTKSMLRLQKEFQMDTLIKLVSYTVDPEHDSVPILRKFAYKNKINDSFWSIITGEKQQLYEFYKNGYLINALENKDDTTNIENQFIHTEKLVLIDDQFRIRGFYDGTNEQSIKILINDILRLRIELRKKQRKFTS